MPRHLSIAAPFHGPRAGTPPVRSSLGRAVLAVLATMFAGVVPVAAQSPAPGSGAPHPVLNRGDAVVTGFSGIRPVPVPVFPGANPLDHFTIDGDGVAAQILSLRQLAGPARGQLTSPPPLLQLKAGEIGQVFAIALDDGKDRAAPDIYLGQTAAYGLHIMDPDGLGPGRPKRLTNGKAGARWMPAQLGGAPAPGAIWRIDGVTGKASIFAMLPRNSGAGIGDITFDARSGSFYVSDLDNGLVQRIGRDGRLLETFDHGVAGRPRHGLAPVADDGRVLDLADAAFSVADPRTWGQTQPARRVHGMAVHGERLYYAVMEGEQIWSVGLAADGRIGDDARWELDASPGPNSREGGGVITDMLFDGEGRMLLARRGGQRGSYDFSIYAEPGQSSVLRYRLKAANDPPSPGRWTIEPEEYASGLPVQHRAETGGIALGYAHDPSGRLNGARCDAMLWSTGDRLRTPALTGDLADPVTDMNDVHGLQGNELGLVRPQNVPPVQSYFIDYDGMSGDAAKAGHVGDVEIWQPCNKPDLAEAPASRFPPGYLPPRAAPPADYPAEYPPPAVAANANLKLTKRILSDTCVPWGGGHACFYRVRIRNTGPDAYTGPLLIDDWLPLAPAGAAMGFAATGWTCWSSGPAAHRCWRPASYLAPGNSLSMTVATWVPNAYPFCHLQNAASLAWAPSGTRWNTDPLDDLDAASGLIAAPHCPLPLGAADLLLKMQVAPGSCAVAGGQASCIFQLQVSNTGPGAFQGPVTIADLPMDGAAATFGQAQGWTCGGGAGAQQCTMSAMTLHAGESKLLSVQLKAPLAAVTANGCRIDNAARILTPPGSAAGNQNPANDADGASGRIDAPQCVAVAPKAKAAGCPPGYDSESGQCVSKQRIIGPATVPPVVIPPIIPPVVPPVVPARCPQGTIGMPPNCRAIERPECPEGTVGTPPNCRRIEQPECPDGTVGRPPNCRKIEPPKCPDGTTGRPPNCKRIEPERCPEGTVGRPPNCRKVEPPKCPEGTTGRPPNCKRVEPEKCPAGTTGRPPNCRKFEPVKCPEGTTGRPPNCHRIEKPKGNAGGGNSGSGPRPNIERSRGTLNRGSSGNANRGSDRRGGGGAR